MVYIKGLWHVCIISDSFSISQTEMFKALERDDSGKIELDMQQVCEKENDKNN